MKANRYILVLLIPIALAFVLGSCGSSKTTTATPKAKTTSTTVKKPEPKKNHHGRKAGQDMASALVDEARTWIGTPYLYGGKTREGADCSGFVMQVFHDAAGLDIPRTSGDQDVYCEDLERDELEAGDLIFFSSKKSGGKIAHVGMYIGNGKMIHSSSSRGVIESSIDQTYYTDHYVKAGRVPSIARMSPPRRKKQPVVPETEEDHEPAICHDPDTETEIGSLAMASTASSMLAPVPAVQIAKAEKPVAQTVKADEPVVAPAVVAPVVDNEDEEPSTNEISDPESIVKNAFRACLTIKDNGGAVNR